MIYDVDKPTSDVALTMMPYVNSIPDTISEEVVRNVLWHFGQPQGWRPGAFVETLLSAFGKADQQNYMRLSYGFSEYAYAMSLSMHVADGLDTLKNMIKER